MKLLCNSHSKLCIRTLLQNVHRTLIPKLQTVPARGFCNRNLLSLEERGLVSAIFPENRTSFTNLCNGKEQTVYAGFDPTAESLHVGNLAVLMMLLHCQRAGHRVIALIGGATGMVGDPSGRNTERPELDPQIVRDNCSKISQNISTVFENHEKFFWDSKKGKEKLPVLKIVNNREWYESTSSLELIGKYGRFFRITDMLSRQSVKSRLDLGEGMSFTEFSYQVFQAYDWFHLHKTFGCNIQIGGNDQMGNMVSGHELISRALNKQVYGLTVPLIKSESGNKYGKTAGNAIWLDPRKTSPFDLYQFLVRTADADVKHLLEVFTFKTSQEIEAIMKKHLASPEKKYAATKLAKEVTKLVHGEKGLESALRATEALYSENIEALSSLTVAEVTEIFNSPSSAVGTAELLLEPGTTILDMALKAGCFKTLNDAMRIIDAGGFYLNYRRIKNHEEVIVPGVHILQNQMSLARVGKKNYYVIRWS